MEEKKRVNQMVRCGVHAPRCKFCIVMHLLHYTFDINYCTYGKLIEKRKDEQEQWWLVIVVGIAVFISIPYLFIVCIV